MKTVNKALIATYALAIFTVGAVLATEAKAETQYSAIVHLVSKHGDTERNYKFNEVNPGVAIRAEFDRDLSVQAGVYKNSYSNTTAYAAVQYTPVQVANVRFGGFAGVGTGYTEHNPLSAGKLSMLGGAMAIAEFGSMSVTVRGIPRISKNMAGVVSLEVGYKF